MVFVKKTRRRICPWLGWTSSWNSQAGMFKSSGPQSIVPPKYYFDIGNMMKIRRSLSISATTPRHADESDDKKNPPVPRLQLAHKRNDTRLSATYFWKRDFSSGCSGFWPSGPTTTGLFRWGCVPDSFETTSIRGLDVEPWALVDDADRETV